MSKNTALKDIRKQLKNVVQDEMPNILKQELTQALYKEIIAAVSGKLQVIDADIRKALKQMDDRQKDVQSYIMRQVTQQQVAVGATGQPETAAAPGLDATIDPSVQ